MSYLDLFQRYGYIQEDSSIDLRGYLQRPDKITELKQITSEDMRAERMIKEAEELVENLQDYRRELAARYAALSTMAYTLRLEIVRNIQYDKHKSYTIRIVKRYEDGGEVEELRETYPGKERRKALDRFESLHKERPGIQTVKDIAKGPWER